MNAGARAAVLLSTAASVEEAEALAKTLVGERLAACVNVVPGVRSVYRWRGEVMVDAEVLMVIKTSDRKLEPLRQRLRELHSYELPELIRIDPDGGDPEYLAWLLASTQEEV